MAVDRAGSDPVVCLRCAGAHSLIACPFVKAIDFEEYLVEEDPRPMRIRRLEFLTPADYGRAAPAASPEPEYPSLRRS